MFSHLQEALFHIKGVVILVIFCFPQSKFGLSRRQDKGMDTKEKSCQTAGMEKVETSRSYSCAPVSHVINSADPFWQRLADVVDTFALNPEARLVPDTLEGESSAPRAYCAIY